MKPIYVADQVRAAERATGDQLASGRLMALAAAGLASEVQAELKDLGLKVRGARLLVAAGPGDNGGDGLFAGARLAKLGARVLVWRAFESAHRAGWAALLAAGGVAVDAAGALAALDEVDLVVDAVFGIGARAGLPQDVAALAAACRARAVPVVAADLPSGLEADAAVPAGESFWATRTVAFGAWKPCHEFQPARDRCGARRLVDIGLELPEPHAEQFELADLGPAWPWPTSASDKYSRGTVGVDTGSDDYPGAAVLTVLGATYSGAGFIKYVGPNPTEVRAAAPNVVCVELDQLEPAWPGAKLMPGYAPLAGVRHVRADAWLVGSGWGGRSNAAPRLWEILDQGVPTVVDAEAIDMFGALVAEGATTPRAPVLLTPHAGELGRLLGVERAAVEADPVAAVQEASRRTGATVLLKGATQYVATPGHDTTHVCFPGPAWTAQAGSGDVLAGIAATLLAAGLPPVRAAGLAGSIQALAAVRHLGPHPPQDLARFLPEVIASLV